MAAISALGPIELAVAMGLAMNAAVVGWIMLPYGEPMQVLA